MKTKTSIPKILTIAGALACVIGFGLWDSKKSHVLASSHREAPLIANDPLADNTDVYAFRSPDDTNTVTIIANYIPFELPQGGPNYYSFGENIRYEIHIKNNDSAGNADDITYRFTFTQKNQDSTTFFNIRLGKQNLMTTYTVQKSIEGHPFFTIVASGTVPPNYIGPRSIDSLVGLGLGTETYAQMAIKDTMHATGGGEETIFCGPVDDPFFVDLGGVFDLGETRNGGHGAYAPEDGCACKNVHAIVIRVPISTLQWHHLSTPVNILDPNFIIGVWASASRPAIRTLNANGTITDNGSWVQVSRLGMPLTNEVINPIGYKDLWNSLTPYNENATMDTFFCRPELALYMTDSGGGFGAAIPGFSKLRIQRFSLQAYGFCNDQQGLYALKATNAGVGTALDTNTYGDYLLRKNSPRSVDLLPIFHTGVPNEAPYQLATGKPVGSPLSNGKPFINNFLPAVLGDMLRLNMAVPVTSRDSSYFSSDGLIQAAVLGLTNSKYDGSANMQWIPNMDGFPNGRRLEDDVTRIELQAVSGAVLAAIGLWYDDYIVGIGSPVTTDLTNVLGYATGVNANDTTFKPAFPYVQDPWNGYGRCGGTTPIPTGIFGFGTGLAGPVMVMGQNYPNPFTTSTNFKIHVSTNINVSLYIYDLTGKRVATIVNNDIKAPGTYVYQWNPNGKVATGVYIATLTMGDQVMQTMKITAVK
jgi:hypothetical protein